MRHSGLNELNIQDGPSMKFYYWHFCGRFKVALEQCHLDYIIGASNASGSAVGLWLVVYGENTTW